MSSAQSSNEQHVLIVTGSSTTASQLTSEQCEPSKPGSERYLSKIIFITFNRWKCTKYIYGAIHDNCYSTYRSSMCPE